MKLVYEVNGKDVFSHPIELDPKIAFKKLGRPLLEEVMNPSVLSPLSIFKDGAEWISEEHGVPLSDVTLRFVEE